MGGRKVGNRIISIKLVHPSVIAERITQVIQQSAYGHNHVYNLTRKDIARMGDRKTMRDITVLATVAELKKKFHKVVVDQTCDSVTLYPDVKILNFADLLNS